MKKTLILIGFIIGMNLTSFAQEVTLSKSELENVLCKQWQIEYAMMNGMKIEQMPPASDFDIKFKSDGKYDLIRKDGKNASGVWTYDVQNKFVELAIKEKITSRIKSINKTKLILTLVSGHNAPPGIQNVEFHLKPI